MNCRADQKQHWNTEKLNMFIDYMHFCMLDAYPATLLPCYPYTDQLAENKDKNCECVAPQPLSGALLQLLQPLSSV